MFFDSTAMPVRFTFILKLLRVVEQYFHSDHYKIMVNYSKSSRNTQFSAISESGNVKSILITMMSVKMIHYRTAVINGLLLLVEILRCFLDDCD